MLDWRKKLVLSESWKTDTRENLYRIESMAGYTSLLSVGAAYSRIYEECGRGHCRLGIDCIHETLT